MQRRKEKLSRDHLWNSGIGRVTDNHIHKLFQLVQFFYYTEEKEENLEEKKIKNWKQVQLLIRKKKCKEVLRKNN